jgi:hypothetical protein
MEENMSNPMRTFQGFVDHIFIKWLARGILERWGDKVKRRLFEVSKKGLGKIFLFLFFCEDF